MTDKYTLSSTKGSQTVRGDLASALLAAIVMEQSLQPAHGVTIECPDGRAFECRGGHIAVESTNAGEDDEAGSVYVDPDGNLCIAWDQGTSTCFFDNGLIAA